VRYVLGKAELTGHSVHSAVAQQSTIGQWVVNYTLTKTGSPLWDKVAEENFHALLAIELDGVVQSAPLIQPSQASFTSFDGQGEISGSFTESSAKNLALAMQFGSLPVRLVPLTTQTVSASLGHGDLVAGLGRRPGRSGTGPALHHSLLPRPGLVILLGLAATGALLMGHHLGAGPYGLGPEFRLGWCYRIDCVHWYHGRQLHRVFRTIKGRGPSKGARSARPSTGASARPGARCWPPTR
jgi:hypothetical protein